MARKVRAFASALCVLPLIAGAVCAAQFTDNGNGTVSDKSTGLIWQQAKGEKHPWNDAKAYCDGLSLAGKDDWRLPTKDELITIVDKNNFSPAIDESFFPEVFGTSGVYYWTSTPVEGSDEEAHIVRFFDGEPATHETSRVDGVRCVRNAD